MNPKKQRVAKVFSSQPKLPSIKFSKLKDQVYPFLYEEMGKLLNCSVKNVLIPEVIDNEIIYFVDNLLVGNIYYSDFS